MTWGIGIFFSYWTILPLAGWVQPLSGATSDSNDPAILQIRVIEGEGAAYPIGSRATRGITVQITDETGRPVEGVTVSFSLPATGPGGLFASGASSEIVPTRSDGRASVWGMQWNQNAGSFEIRVTAVKGQARAGIVCPQFLSDAPSRKEASSRIGPGGHKWIWIGLAVAAGAGAALATAGLAKKPGTATTGPEINAPSIILSHP